MIDMAMAKMDFGIDDFVKANKGQVLISFSDPKTENEKQPAAKKAKGVDMHDVPGMKTGMKVLFATAVNDKVAFEKMVTMVWDMVKKLKGGDMGSKELPFSYKLENNWFAASNSQEFTDKFLAGGDNRLPFTDKITGHPIGMYIDLQKMMGSVHSKFSNADTANKKELAEAIKMWQDIVATGGEYKDDATQFEVEVNLVDKSTNSLKQMNQYLDKMLSLKKERKKFEIKEVTLEDIKQEEEKPEPPPPPPPSKKKNK
jgi:hypothetical protein